MKSLYNLVLLIQYVYLVVVGLRWPSNTKMEKLTMQNIRLDNERLQHETLKFKKKTQKMSEELFFIQNKELYYWKIQSEFNVFVLEPIS